MEIGSVYVAFVGSTAGTGSLSHKADLAIDLKNRIKKNEAHYNL